MPSSPKFFYPRQQWLSPSQRSIIAVCCLAIGIAGIAFGSIAAFRPISGYRCRDYEPLSVSVSWENGDSRRSGDPPAIVGGSNRHKVMGFVGIQTGFGSVGRRRSLRKTWMPSDRRGLRRWVFGNLSISIQSLSLKKKIRILCLCFGDLVPFICLWWNQK